MSTFEEDRKIDPNALDIALLEHADRFSHWAELWAEAANEVERLELAFEVLEAELSIKIRDEWTGDSKPTVDAVKALVTSNEKRVAKAQVLLKAKADALMLKQAVNGMDQRRSMLEKLVQLHGQNYFAGPREPRNLPREHRRLQEAREGQANKKLKKRKRAD